MIAHGRIGQLNNGAYEQGYEGRHSPFALRASAVFKPGGLVVTISPLFA